MRARLRTTVAAAVSAVAVLSSLGCGNSGNASVNVPPGAVATVGDTVITRSAFVAQLRLEAARRAKGGTVVPYDFPRFDACAAAKRNAPNSSGGRQECKREFERLRPAAMKLLLQGEWLKQDAAARGLSLSAKELDAGVRKRQRVLGGTQSKRYQATLRSQGFTEQSLRESVRRALLIEKIRKSVNDQVAAPSASQVAQFYEANKQAFALPERRDVRLVLARSEAKAEQAKRALADGESWEAVARRYSIDPASKDKGGKLKGYKRSKGAGELDDALFETPKGTLSGPLETQFGWYVFIVEKIMPARQQPLKEVRGELKDYLRRQEQTRVLTEFSNDWVSRYQGRTACAEDFKVAGCGNGSGDDSSGSGTTQSPQQAPQ